ncbi:TPA: DNA primase [Yersinia enterocolitica]|nr:DNA primase [Yersinia enterocolitica]HDL7797752.1 DNA primase [Yersinia enterocolitica]
MKYAPNVKHLPKDKGTEAVIFAGSKAWEMAKAYQKDNSDDDVPPVVLDHQQLSELESLNIIDKGRMFARVYQAGIIDQARISQILQKLAKAKVKQAQLYNEAGELLEDWTPQLQEITTSQRTVIHSHDSATPALNQMGASQRGQVLLAHYGGELAIDSDSDTVHHYNGVIWEPVTDKELQREMASIFSEAEIAYSQSGVKSAVDTMKLSLPQMGTPSRQMIGFNNGVFDLKTGTFREHRRDDWLLIASGVDFSPPEEGETLTTHAPHFWRWLNHSVSGNARKADRVLAALYMVMANRYDWQLFLEITGAGGSGKSVFAEICTLLAGRGNTVSANMKALEEARERALLVGYSLIIMPDMARYAGDGAGIKAITGGDKVAIDPKHKAPYSVRIPAVVLAVNNNAMTFSDRSGGISRRRVIFNFSEVVPENERDPQLAEKIEGELAVIIRHLLARFAHQSEAKQLLYEQQKSEEALAIKREGDSLVDFCGYLTAAAECNGMLVGNAEIVPFNPWRYLYHAYLAYMRGNGLGKPVSLTRFGTDMCGAMAEYGGKYLKKKTKHGVRSNMSIKDDASEWMPAATGGVEQDD